MQKHLFPNELLYVPNDTDAHNVTCSTIFLFINPVVVPPESSNEFHDACSGLGGSNADCTERVTLQ